MPKPPPSPTTRLTSRQRASSSKHPRTTSRYARMGRKGTPPPRRLYSLSLTPPAPTISDLPPNSPRQPAPKPTTHQLAPPSRAPAPQAAPRRHHARRCPIPKRKPFFRANARSAPAIGQADGHVRVPDLVRRGREWNQLLSAQILGRCRPVLLHVTSPSRHPRTRSSAPKARPREHHIVSYRLCCRRRPASTRNRGLRRQLTISRDGLPVSRRRHGRFAAIEPA